MEKNCAIFGLDDDPDILNLISMFFDRDGISNYHLYINEKKFIEDFTEAVPIAFIDHYLDGRSVGFDIMEKIFELNERNNSILKCKVIIISGQQDPQMIAYYLNQGAFRYLDKNDPDFYKQLVAYTKKAIEEVDSFLKSIDRFKSRSKEINRLFDYVKGE